jgi:GNAT superfamily N-acetyltransferase
METWRAAFQSDAERIAELAAAMAEELNGFRGGDIWARRDALPLPLVDSYRSLIEAIRVAGSPTDDRAGSDGAGSDGAGCLLVGCIDDTVVGFGWATTERFRDGASLGAIRELYVEPGAREVGVGEVLLGALVEWCRDKGCLGVDSTALPGHRATKNFFEEQGFVARSIVMHHRFEA